MKKPVLLICGLVMLTGVILFGMGRGRLAGKPQTDPGAAGSDPSPVVPAERFLQLASQNPAQSAAVIRQIDQTAWHPGASTLMFEAARLSRSADVLSQVIWLAETKTGQSLGQDVNAWNRWIWSQPYTPYPDYLAFKRQLYSQIDPRFAAYFRSSGNDRIRWDEVVWGGVKQDGIPPLKNPAMVPARQAGYLNDDDVVFGVAWQADACCYPKRILAWHEMFKDTIGGLSVCGVY